MKAVIIWLSSFLLAGIITSPFLWLRFLKKKNVWGYIICSSLIVMAIFYFFMTRVYDFVLKSFIHSYNSLDYFDGISMGFICIVLLFFLISPFIFTKIAFGKIKTKSFIASFGLSILIFIIYACVFIYVLLPRAFGELLKHF